MAVPAATGVATELNKTALEATAPLPYYSTA